MIKDYYSQNKRFATLVQIPYMSIEDHSEKLKDVLKLNHNKLWLRN
jgi:hypothetical protein